MPEWDPNEQAQALIDSAFKLIGTRYNNEAEVMTRRENIYYARMIVRAQIGFLLNNAPEVDKNYWRQVEVELDSTI
jgi:hypothetical protein